MKHQFGRAGSKLGLGFIALLAALSVQAAGTRWTTERAHAWQQSLPWTVGCNYSPSTAINQLEMWQAETFDPVTIDRELAWAEGLGFTGIRVFLHDLPWRQDSSGYLQRIDRFLGLADKHHIRVMFVLLDAVWDPFPKSGLQHAPKPGVHNSGWVQSPGVEILRDPARHAELQGYVTGVLTHCRADPRVLAWDIFNEPDNMNRPAYVAAEPANKAELSLILLQKAFAWARAVDPSQPLTTGVWLGDWGDPEKLSALEKYILDESDVISFHNYGDLADMKNCVRNLKRFGRPVLCTEYMARPRQSTFNPILGFLQLQGVGAMNWGFVAGKTQTIYPWDSWDKPYAAEPPVWFHDIFRVNGTPYDSAETAYIKMVTTRAQNAHLTSPAATSGAPSPKPGSQPAKIEPKVPPEP